MIYLKLSKKSRGVALVMVLSCIVLIVALVIGLMIRASSEKISSASFSAASASRRLADNVVNLVQAQINNATTQKDTGWASQPGAVRVFTSTGVLQDIYLLYSGKHLTTSRSSDLDNDIPPSNWESQPALWVDLNTPADANGFLDSENQTLQSFPILTPKGSLNLKNVSDNLGFSIDSPPGVSESHPAPMPVRWLYVLENGSIVAPVSGSKEKSATIPGASKSNPITGRIAFWTDDDSCKININTASDGAFWDIPRFETNDDRKYAINQPANGEYQRYPGHPATTSLYELFHSIGLPFDKYPSEPGKTSDFFKLLPRYNDDQGSKLGTLIPTTGPTPKSDRLYSSVGEMLYDPERKPTPLNREQVEFSKFLLTAKSRAPELTLFGTPRIAIWPVHANLEDDPNSPYTTVFDRLSAFCATIGNKKRYYFQRKDSSSPTTDFTGIQRNQQLYAYLQNLTSRSVPGSGGNFLAKYGSDRDQILTEIFDYIRCTNLSDDNLSNSITSNYQYTTPNTQKVGHGQVAPIKIGSTQGGGRFYTISEVGLLFICTADGNGPLPATNGSANDARSVSNLDTPQKLKDSTGTLVGTDNVAGGPNFPANPTLADTFGGPLAALSAGQKRVQAMLLLELNCPMQGFTNIVPNFSFRVTGLPSLTVAGVNPFPAASNATIIGPKAKIGTTVESGGVNGVRHFLTLSNSTTYFSRVNGWSNPSASNAYPFVSNPFTVSGNTISLTNGGPVTIEILMKDSSGTDNVIQTFNVTFPSTTLPTPDLLRYGVNGGTGTTANDASFWWGFDYRIGWANGSIGKSGGRQGIGCVIRLDPRATTVVGSPWTLLNSKFITDYYTSITANSDVVRSMMPLSGDVRLSALSSTIEISNSGSSLFQKHPQYDNGTQKLAHSFMERTSSGFMAGVSSNNALITGVTYGASDIPDVPGDVGTAAASGDWDNGLPQSQDGAYFNKADEGNIQDLATSFVPYYSTAGQNTAPGKTFFTPNRIIPSAVMFGSLPTGVKSGTPWKTLRFRPSDEVTTGQSLPKDHYLLDLFSMPVVEPYAISEPFSTSGKINLNYQIIPFKYITRSTGIRALLRNEKVTKIPKSLGATYKSGPTSNISNRLGLNLSEKDGTLAQFKSKFDSGEIFKSATEICDIYLVPEGYTWPSFKTDCYGDDFALVGDNTRERPYSNIFPRVTTKSNTFTVYYTVQTLKTASQNPEEFDETKGSITSEYRGSTTIERYLDPNDKSIPDHATDYSAPSLDNRYKWKVIANHQFAP